MTTENTSIWERFDRFAALAVRKEITFSTFERETVADFARMARIAARRRKLPSWLGLDDLKNQMVELAWHYAFVRKSMDGTIGFNPARYDSAGAYIRWKIRAKIGKVISRARGENQHDRKGPGTPEYLSKTGDVPELGSSPSEQGAEVMLDRSRRLRRLERLCETTREFVLLRALTQGMGDDRRVVGFLLARQAETTEFLGEELVEDASGEKIRKITKAFAVTDAAAANRAINAFVDGWSKKYGAIPLPRRSAA